MINMELSAHIANEKGKLFEHIPVIENTITTDDLDIATELLAMKGYGHSELDFYWTVAMIWRLGVIAGIRAERKRRRRETA